MEPLTRDIVVKRKQGTLIIHEGFTNTSFEECWEELFGKFSPYKPFDFENQNCNI